MNGVKGREISHREFPAVFVTFNVRAEVEGVGTNPKWGGWKTLELSGEIKSAGN